MKLKNEFSLLRVLFVVVFLGFLCSPGYADPVTHQMTVDEYGNSVLNYSAMLGEPGYVGADGVLTYVVGQYATMTSGDVVILDSFGNVSDLIRFTVEDIPIEGTQATYLGLVMRFYSLADGDGSLADTDAFPSESSYSGNRVYLTEGLLPEELFGPVYMPPDGHLEWVWPPDGNWGAVWTPGVGQPGYALAMNPETTIPENNWKVGYTFISDRSVSTVPEPTSLLLLGLSLGGFAMARRGRK